MATVAGGGCGAAVWIGAWGAGTGSAGAGWEGTDAVGGGAVARRVGCDSRTRSDEAGRVDGGAVRTCGGAANAGTAAGVTGNDSAAAGDGAGTGCVGTPWTAGV